MTQLSVRARKALRYLTAIACAAFVFSAAEARAHARLVGANPAAGATVSAPTEIQLEFSEGVESRFSGLTLTAAGGAPAQLGPATIEAGHQNVLIVPVAKLLSPGAYTLHWHAVSVDTHHTQGTFAFTVR